MSTRSSAKLPREIAKAGNRRRPRFRDEPAALLDGAKLEACEETEAQQRHQRHHQQENQTLRDRHRDYSTI